MVKLTNEELATVKKAHEDRIELERKKEALSQLKTAAEELTRGLTVLSESSDLVEINDGVPELYACLCELKNSVETILPVTPLQPERAA